jgi:hypothetical protein
MLVPVIRRERVAKPPIVAKPLFLLDCTNVLIWKVAILDIVYDDGRRSGVMSLYS